MRDPKRIRRMLEKLEKIWESNPDLRFTQLLIWLDVIKEEVRVNNAGLLKHHHVCNFYTEDDHVEELLDNSRFVKKVGE